MTLGDIRESIEHHPHKLIQVGGLWFAPDNLLPVVDDIAKKVQLVQSGLYTLTPCDELAIQVLFKRFE